jgi:hypothetical protein
MERPDPRLLIADRSMVDAVLPPTAFVLVNWRAGLVTAAASAVGLALVLLLMRLVRRSPAINAVSGLFGVAVAVALALAWGGAEGYFLPRVFSNGALAVGFAVSILVRRPAIALVSQYAYMTPRAWLDHPRVRRVYAEVTWPWVALYALRAALYAIFIAAGDTGLLLAVSVALGLPAFGALVAATFAYIPWRLRRIGAPPQPQPVRPAG